MGIIDNQGFQHSVPQRLSPLLGHQMSEVGRQPNGQQEQERKPVKDKKEWKQHLQDQLAQGCPPHAGCLVPIQSYNPHFEQSFGRRLTLLESEDRPNEPTDPQRSSNQQVIKQQGGGTLAYRGLH